MYGRRRLSELRMKTCTELERTDIVHILKIMFPQFHCLFLYDFI